METHPPRYQMNFMEWSPSARAERHRHAVTGPRGPLCPHNAPAASSSKIAAGTNAPALLRSPTFDCGLSELGREGSTSTFNRQGRQSGMPTCQFVVNTMHSKRLAPASSGINLRRMQGQVKDARVKAASATRDELEAEQG